jgi:hypothetical protein
VCRDSGDSEGRKIAARGAPPTFCLATLLAVGVAPVRHLALRSPRPWITARNQLLCHRKTRQQSIDYGIPAACGWAVVPGHRGGSTARALLTVECRRDCIKPRRSARSPSSPSSHSSHAHMYRHSGRWARIGRVPVKARSLTPVGRFAPGSSQAGNHWKSAVTRRVC